MSTIEYAAKLMAPYEPQVPIPELVEHLNRFYHAREARLYDRQHPEIHQQLVPIWNEMLEAGLGGDVERPLRVLDFGCGTGFEATRLLESRYGASVEKLVCYDLSSEMIEVCRDRLSVFSCPIDFTTSLDEIASGSTPFDLLLTNSLLHHLPDPAGTLRTILPLLSEDAVWLAGHEPSSRFYKNGQCCAAFARFNRARRLRRYASPSSYVNVAKRWLWPSAHPSGHAATSALRAGLVRRKPSSIAVSRLVDFHVAHSASEAASGRGFDFRELEKEFGDQWNLAWHKTYSFMGCFFEGSLSPHWRKRCRELEAKYPDDGNNFCMIWRRCRPTSRQQDHADLFECATTKRGLS